jgi:hypothetical protein
MSTGSEIAERTDEAAVTRRTKRSVKPGYRGRANTEMHTIGLLYAALLAILFVPLLPFVAVGWVVWQVAKGIRAFVGSETTGADETERRRGRAA